MIGQRNWPWFLLAAVFFALLPWLFVDFRGPAIVGFFCGMVAMKWLIFTVWSYRNTGKLRTDSERSGGATSDE